MCEEDTNDGFRKPAHPNSINNTKSPKDHQITKTTFETVLLVLGPPFCYFQLSPRTYIQPLSMKLKAPTNTQ